MRSISTQDFEDRIIACLGKINLNYNYKDDLFLKDILRKLDKEDLQSMPFYKGLSKVLGISEETIQKHIARIIKKTDIEVINKELGINEKPECKTFIKALHNTIKDR